MTLRLSIVAVLALSTACAPTGRPTTAADTALRVFDLARSEHPDPEALDSLFGPDDDASRRAALLDTLAGLGSAERLRVTHVEPLEGLSVTAIDLVARVHGAGQADYSLHLVPEGQRAWRVVWLAGPGVGWPPRAAPRGTGLTTSTPPPGSSAAGWE